MGQQLSCCTLRDCSVRSCELNNSLFGEDAFYRDAFFDCEEGDQSHDWLFALAVEQTRLKYRKVSMVKQYAGFVFVQNAARWLFPGQFAPAVASGLQDRRAPPQPEPSKSSPCKKSQAADWLGKTLKEWTSPGLPSSAEGAFWKMGDGADLRVRCGPGYVKTGQKTDSSGSLYEGIYCDAIKGDQKITDIMGRLVDLNALPKSSVCEGDMSGGQLRWTKECGVPRILCINLMLPYKTGVFGMPDAGCSFVGMFQVKQKTLDALRSGDTSPSLKLWQKFCTGPTGGPGEQSAERSLAARSVKGVKKDRQSGLFKCMAKCVNPEDVKVPEMFHTYNGKPCLITKCGYIIRDPAGEWVEIGIDVRGFNVLARNMLCRFRGLLPMTKIHYGFLVQGVEDEEMPEGLLCDMYVCGVNILTDPVPIG